MSGDMTSMRAAMPMTSAWTLADAISMFVMWAMMMVAMMLPSVTPMVLLYARTVRHRALQGRTGAPAILFVTGYLNAWIGFSLLATLANWALHSGGLLSSSMGSTPANVGGVVLVAAGLYQWTPLKDACLTHCRSPVGFLADHWREGRIGAVTMGMHHGVYCVGCCWLLMALLFVLGVMNLVWIAVLTVFVLLEKVGPRGPLVSRVTGALLVAWGAWHLAT
jgi:predicted metal-binding membrane protein